MTSASGGQSVILQQESPAPQFCVPAHPIACRSKQRFGDSQLPLTAEPRWLKAADKGRQPATLFLADLSIASCSLPEASATATGALAHEMFFVSRDSAGAALQSVANRCILRLATWERAQGVLTSTGRCLDSMSRTVRYFVGTAINIYLATADEWGPRARIA